LRLSFGVKLLNEEILEKMKRTSIYSMDSEAQYDLLIGIIISTA
jgi:hypothetical protein